MFKCLIENVKTIKGWSDGIITSINNDFKVSQSEKTKKLTKQKLTRQRRICSDIVNSSSSMTNRLDIKANEKNNILRVSFLQRERKKLSTINSTSSVSFLSIYFMITSTSAGNAISVSILLTCVFIPFTLEKARNKWLTIPRHIRKKKERKF